MYVEDVKDGIKNIAHTFRLITSLIVNGFSIRRKFWKDETQSFPTIRACNAMYVEAMSKMSKIEHTHTFWLITSLILNGFSIRKKFWKAETESFPTIAIKF